MSTITKRIRDQVVTRLSDAGTGYNATYNGLLATYGLTTHVAVDFSGADHSFFLGYVDPSIIEATGLYKFPMMCIYGVNATDTNRIKFEEFSGDVNINIDYHISELHAKVQFDFESPVDIVEDSIIQIMNRQANQNWDLETVYNGNVSTVRYPLKIGAGNFRQSIRFSLRFEIDSPV